MSDQPAEPRDPRAAETKKAAVSDSPYTGQADMGRAVGRWIREQREARGWTQKELAGRISVRQSTVSDWERGKVDPTNGNIAALSQVLGADPTFALLQDRPLPVLGTLSGDAAVVSLVERYYACTEAQRALVRAVVAAMYETFEQQRHGVGEVHSPDAVAERGGEGESPDHEE